MPDLIKAIREAAHKAAKLQPPAPIEIAMNSFTGQKMLEKAGGDMFLRGSLPSMIWGIPVVYNETIPDDTLVQYRQDLLSKLTESLMIPRDRFWDMYEFSNPFLFLEEFELWFEWARRVYFDGQHTAQATGEMVGWNQDFMAYHARHIFRINERESFTFYAPRMPHVFNTTM